MFKATGSSVLQLLEGYGLRMRTSSNTSLFWTGGLRTYVMTRIFLNFLSLATKSASQFLIFSSDFFVSALLVVTSMI